MRSPVADFERKLTPSSRALAQVGGSTDVGAPHSSRVSVWGFNGRITQNGRSQPWRLGWRRGPSHGIEIHMRKTCEPCYLKTIDRQYHPVDNKHNISPVSNDGASGEAWKGKRRKGGAVPPRDGNTRGWSEVFWKVSWNGRCQPKVWPAGVVEPASQSGRQERLVLWVGRRNPSALCG